MFLEDVKDIFETCQQIHDIESLLSKSFFKCVKAINDYSLKELLLGKCNFPNCRSNVEKNDYFCIKHTFYAYILHLPMSNLDKMLDCFHKLRVINPKDFAWKISGDVRGVPSDVYGTIEIKIFTATTIKEQLELKKRLIKQIGPLDLKTREYFFSERFLCKINSLDFSFPIHEIPLESEFLLDTCNFPYIYNNNRICNETLSTNRFFCEKHKNFAIKCDLWKNTGRNDPAISSTTNSEAVLGRNSVSLYNAKGLQFKQKTMLFKRIRQERLEFHKIKSEKVKVPRHCKNSSKDKKPQEQESLNSVNRFQCSFEDIVCMNNGIHPDFYNADMKYCDYHIGINHLSEYENFKSIEIIQEIDKEIVRIGMKRSLIAKRLKLSGQIGFGIPKDYLLSLSQNST
jgi:hypothetical protein